MFILSTRPRVASFLRLASFLALGALPLRATQSSDSDRNTPNVIAPAYVFGRRGIEPGELRQASALALGRDDFLYIADTGNHRVQKLAANGLPRSSFGSWGQGPSQFCFPSAIAVAADGDIYVADMAGRLQAFSAEGRFLKAWDGLRGPRGIAVTADRVYVSEEDLHRVRYYSRKDGPDGAFGGLGSQPGRFLAPAGLAVDEDGAVYVADSGNHRIQKLDAGGKPITAWGAWGSQAGQLSYPGGLGYADGRVYVADTCNHRIQVFDRNGLLVKQWGAAPSVPDAAAGRLHYPTGLAVAPSGGLTAVSEPVDDRVQVFLNRDLATRKRVNDLPWWDSLHARVHTVRLAAPPPGSPAQMPGALASSDVHAVFFFDVGSNALGPIVTAGGYGPKLGELNGVGGLALDAAAGRAYVGDRGNRRIVVYDLPRNPQRRELFSNTLRTVSSRAFDRLLPPSPGYDPEVALPGPMRFAPDGRLYILDRGNASILVCGADLSVQRRIAVSPNLREFAVAADGTIFATDPTRLCVVVYEADGREKDRWRARGEKDGERFRMPWGVALDAAGFVYVSDALEDVLLKLDPKGRLVKKWGAPGRQPDRLMSPRGLTFHAPDRLLVEDYGNHRAQLCNTEGDFLGNYVAGGLATPIAIR